MRNMFTRGEREQNTNIYTLNCFLLNIKYKINTHILMTNVNDSDNYIQCHPCLFDRSTAARVSESLNFKIYISLTLEPRKDFKPRTI